MKKFLITISTSIALLLGIGSEASAASNTYTVKNGDSLSKIAKTYHVTVTQLKEWNHLSSDLIKINEVLNITNTGTSTATISPKFVKETSVATNTYTVKSGDTLSKIAKTYSISVAQLKDWNHLSSDVIKVNQVLTLVGSATSAQTSAITNTVAKTLTVSASAYTMNCKNCSGITAMGINLKKNPTIKLISVDPKVIKLGSKVNVPGYGVAVAGDTGGAIKGNKIDIFMSSQTSAIQWGRKTIKIQVLN